MLLLFGAVGMAFSQSASPDRGRPPISIASAAQPQRGTLEDDFAGMSFTDDQQQQINKIRQETAARRDVVSKDTKLTADQKDAMIVGYSRMEYVAIFKVLTPEQQKQVRMKISARHAADQVARKKQSPSR